MVLPFGSKGDARHGDPGLVQATGADDELCNGGCLTTAWETGDVEDMDAGGSGCNVHAGVEGGNEGGVVDFAALNL